MTSIEETLLNFTTNTAFRWSPLGEVTELLSLGHKSMGEFYPELIVNPRTIGVAPSSFGCTNSPQSKSTLDKTTFAANGCNRQDKVLCLIGKTIVVREVDHNLKRNSKEPSHKAEAIEFNVDYIQDDSYLQVHSEIHKEESQKRMYCALGVPCIESAFEGYNTTILAYGQTGSGKTYTMMGDSSKGGRGLIPRLAYDLMTKIKEESGHGVICTVQVSYLEIYQEKIRDLLAEDEEAEEEVEPSLISPSTLESGAISSGDEKFRVGRYNLEDKVTNSHGGSMMDNTYTNSFLYKTAIQRQLETSQKQPRIISEAGKSLLEMPCNGSSQEGVLKAKSPKTKPVFDTVFRRQKVHKHYRTFPIVMEEAVPVRKQHFLKIREHPITGPFVEGLLWKDVRNWYDMENLMKQGSTSRTTAATDMNEQSSRSHAVFAIRLTRKLGTDLLGVQPSSVSYINLVDLAGNEKLPKLCSGAITGQRTLEESRCINRSLSQLNEVILSLSRSSFVSYRNCVLTWLLKESLGGNSRTFMVANISPTEKDLRESINTLRYATTASRIPPPATVDQDPRNKLINKLKEEISTLRTLLSSFTSVEKNATSDRLPSMQGFKVPCLDVGLQVEHSCSHNDDNLGRMPTELLNQGSQTENSATARVKEQTPPRSSGSVDGSFRIRLKDCVPLDMGNVTILENCGAVDIGHQTFSINISTSNFAHQACPEDLGVINGGHEIKLRGSHQSSKTDCGATYAAFQGAPQVVNDGQQNAFGGCAVVDLGDQISLLKGWESADVRNHSSPLRNCGEVVDAGPQSSSKRCRPFNGGCHYTLGYWGNFDVGNEISGTFGTVDTGDQVTMRCWGDADGEYQNALQYCEPTADSGLQMRIGDVKNPNASWNWETAAIGFQITFEDVDVRNELTSRDRHQVCWRDMWSSDIGHQVKEDNSGAFDADQHNTLKDCSRVQANLGNLTLRDSKQQGYWTELGAIDVGHQVALNDQATDRNYQQLGKGYGSVWPRHQTTLDDRDGTNFESTSGHSDPVNKDHYIGPEPSGLADIDTPKDQLDPNTQITIWDSDLTHGGQETELHNPGQIELGLQDIHIYARVVDAEHQSDWVYLQHSGVGHQTSCSVVGQRITITDFGATDVAQPNQWEDLRSANPGCQVPSQDSWAIDIGQQASGQRLGKVDHQVYLHMPRVNESGTPLISKHNDVNRFEDKVDWRPIDSVAQEDNQRCLRGSSAVDMGCQTGLKVKQFRDKGLQAHWIDMAAAEFGHQTNLDENCGVAAAQVEQHENFDGSPVADIGLRSSRVNKEPQSQFGRWHSPAMEFGCQVSFKECGVVAVRHQSTSADLKALPARNRIIGLDDYVPNVDWRRSGCGVCGASPGNSLMAVTTMLPIHETAAAADVGIQTLGGGAKEVQLSGNGWGASSEIIPEVLGAANAPRIVQRKDLRHSHQPDRVCCKQTEATDSTHQKALDGCESLGLQEERPVKHADCENAEIRKDPTCGRPERKCSAQNWEQQYGPYHGIAGTEPRCFLTGSAAVISNADDDSGTGDARWGRGDPNSGHDILSKHVRNDIGIEALSRNYSLADAQQQSSCCWRWEEGINFGIAQIDERFDFKTREDNEPVSARDPGNHSISGDKQGGGCVVSQHANLQNEESDTLASGERLDGDPRRDDKSDCVSWLNHYIRKKRDSEIVPAEEAVQLCSLWILSKLRGRMERYSINTKRKISNHSSFLTESYESIPQSSLSSTAADDAIQKHPRRAEDSGQHETNLSKLVLHLCSLWIFVKLRTAGTENETLEEGQNHLASKKTRSSATPPRKVRTTPSLPSAAAAERQGLRLRGDPYPRGLKQLQYSGVEPVTFKSSAPFFIQTSGDCSLVKTKLNPNPPSNNTKEGPFYNILCGYPGRRVVHFLKDGVNRLGSNKGAHLHIKGLSEHHTEFIYMPARRCVRMQGYVVARVVSPGALAFLNGLPMVEHKELGTGDVLVLRDTGCRSSVCTLHFFDLLKSS